MVTVFNLGMGLAINTNIKIEFSTWAVNVVDLVLASEVNINFNLEDSLVTAVAGAFDAVFLNTAFWLGLNVEFNIELSVTVSLFSDVNVWLKI